MKGSSPQQEEEGERAAVSTPRHRSRSLSGKKGSGSGHGQDKDQGLRRKESSNVDIRCVNLDVEGGGVSLFWVQCGVACRWCVSVCVWSSVSSLCICICICLFKNSDSSEVRKLHPPPLIGLDKRPLDHYSATHTKTPHIV